VKVRLRCSPGVPVVECAEMIEGAVASPTSYDLVASIVRSGDLYLSGLHEVTASARSPEPSSPSSDPVRCRAYFKLQEAMTRSGLSLPPEARALDAGAAPGGWTEWLVDNGCAHVTAVDPSEMDVSDLEGVTHIKARLEDALPQIQASSIRYDAYVSDMRLPLGLSAVDEFLRVVNSGVLQDKAIVVISIKGSEAKGHSEARFEELIQPQVNRFASVCSNVQVSFSLENARGIASFGCCWVKLRSSTADL